MSNKNIRHLGPLYLNSSRVEILLCWMGIIANILLVAASSVFVIFTWETSSLSIWTYPIIALVVILLADFLSGVIHWSTDTYFDELSFKRVICIAREHHFNPHNIVHYGYRDYAAFGSWPSLFLAGPFLLVSISILPLSTISHTIAVVFCSVAACLHFAVYTHRMGHRWSSNFVIRYLQKRDVLHSPKHHVVHHESPHLIRYCAFTGWANWFCDTFRVWRFFELVIDKTIRVKPRKNEREWDIRLESGSSFFYDPIPSLIELRGMNQDPRSESIDLKTFLLIAVTGGMIFSIYWGII